MNKFFGYNDRHTEQEIRLKYIQESVSQHGLNDLRNRVLILISAATGFSLKVLCRLKLWQVTFWHYSDQMRFCRVAIACPAPSKYPLGIYSDSTFNHIIPLNLDSRHSLRRYIVRLFDHGLSGESYLFPVIDKGEHVKGSRCIDTTYAKKFLREAKVSLDKSYNITWPEIQQLAVARRLARNNSVKSIVDNTGYGSRSNIYNIAKHFGYKTPSNAKYKALPKIGYDYIGSFLTDNFPWYLDKIEYQYTGHLIEAINSYRIRLENRSVQPTP